MYIKIYKLCLLFCNMYFGLDGQIILLFCFDNRTFYVQYLSLYFSDVNLYCWLCDYVPLQMIYVEININMSLSCCFTFKISFHFPSNVPGVTTKSWKNIAKIFVWPLRFLRLTTIRSWWGELVISLSITNRWSMAFSGFLHQ